MGKKPTPPKFHHRNREAPDETVLLEQPFYKKGGSESSRETNRHHFSNPSPLHLAPQNEHEKTGI